jgi:hypothetical protein
MVMQVASVKTRDNVNGETLTKANREWAKRPADQRFDSLESLLTAVKRHRDASVTASGKLSDMRIKALDSGDLAIVGKAGNSAIPTNWAFSQLCRTIKAPAEYLSRLPADLVAANLNCGLAARAKQGGETESSLLLSKATGAYKLAAVTSQEYARVWNAEVVQSLVSLRERQPSWQFPEPFRKVGSGGRATWGQADGKQVPIAFASDRDLFVFLVDYEHPIEVDGNPMARGFFCEATECGDGSHTLTTFLFDFVCSNILVWGARQISEIRIRHVGNARDRVLDLGGDVLQRIETYGRQSARAQEAQIRNAQAKILGKDQAEVVEVLSAKTDLPKGTINAAYTLAAETPRYGDPRSAWGIVNGLTEVSQKAEYMDARAKIDRAAGRVLGFAF